MSSKDDHKLTNEKEPNTACQYDEDIAKSTSEEKIEPFENDSSSEEASEGESESIFQKDPFKDDIFT
jgi:hypothetical protein